MCVARMQVVEICPVSVVWTYVIIYTVYNRIALKKTKPEALVTLPVTVWIDPKGFDNQFFSNQTDANYAKNCYL